MLPYFESGRNVRLQLNASHNNLPHEKSENVEVLPTGLRILQSGLYQVYSNIHFKTDNSRPCSAYPLKVRREQDKAVYVAAVHLTHVLCTFPAVSSCTSGSASVTGENKNLIRYNCSLHSFSRTHLKPWNFMQSDNFYMMERPQGN